MAKIPFTNNEEIASAQTQTARAQAMEKARSVDSLGQRDLAQVAAAVCPKCGPSYGA